MILIRLSTDSSPMTVEQQNRITDLIRRTRAAVSDERWQSLRVLSPVMIEAQWKRPKVHQHQGR